MLHVQEPAAQTTDLDGGIGHVDGGGGNGGGCVALFPDAEGFLINDAEKKLSSRTHEYLWVHDVRTFSPRRMWIHPIKFLVKQTNKKTNDAPGNSNFDTKSGH